MKTFAKIAFLLLSTVSAQAQYGYNNNRGYGSSYGSSYGYGTGSNPNSYQVKPYYNNNGTYVQGHRATNPNDTKLDNYSTKGNYNPYTGKYGTKNPW